MVLVFVLAVTGITFYTHLHPLPVTRTAAALETLQYDREAYDTLMKANTFSNGGTGVAGSMSPETKAYAVLMKNKNAFDLFYHLEQEANNQGRLYALCAMYQLDNQYFNTIQVRYLNSIAEIKGLFGCIQVGVPMCDIADKDSMRAMAQYIASSHE